MICSKMIRFADSPTFDIMNIDMDSVQVLKEYSDGEVFCKYKGEYCFIKF